MSLQKLVRFRYLAAQLSPSESAEFAINLINLPNDFLINTLFHHFIKQISTNNDSDLNAVNNTISNIILSRKKKQKPNEISAPQNIKLEHLPSQLLGYTASFLNQYEYIAFNQSSRLFYLSTNTPNTLQNLDLMSIRNYARINLSLFPFLRSLSLDLTEIKGFIPAQTCSFNHLECVTLYGARQQDIDINILNNFLLTHHVNIDSITTLICWRFGNPNTISFNAATFAQLLEIFPNTQYLRLCGVCADIDADHIKSIYPNLKGLSLEAGDSDFYRPLIHAFGINLQCLELYQYHFPLDYSLDNICFSELKELILWRPTVKNIDDILKTAVNLKKIAIQPTYAGTTHLKASETKDICDKLIKTCKSLEYIKFIDVGNDNLVGSALEGIENGLFGTSCLHCEAVVC